MSHHASTRTSRASRRALPLANLALLVVLLAACGGGGGGSSSSSTDADGGNASSAADVPATGLAQALAGVRATDVTGAYVEWSDLDRLYAAAGIERPAAGEPPAYRELGRWRDLIGLGGGNAVRSGSLLRDDIGVDPLAATQLLSVGEGRDQALRLIGGQDGAAIRAALLGAGLVEETSPGGASLLTRGDDDAEEPDGTSSGTSLGVLRPFDAVGLTGSDLVAAPTAEGADDLLQPSPSLAESPAHRAVADCLGDPLAAMEFGGRVVERLEGVSLIGIGVIARDGGAVNVLCIASDAASAPQREAAMRAALDPEAADPEATASIADSVASAEIGTTPVGDLRLVRAELLLTLETPANYLVRQLFNFGLEDVLGPARGASEPDGSSGADERSSAP